MIDKEKGDEALILDFEQTQAQTYKALDIYEEPTDEKMTT